MILRHLASTSLMAIYLATIVGGETFHQLQHVVADGACFGHSDGDASSTDDATKGLCSHSHTEHSSDLSSKNEQLSGTDSPLKHQQEESSSDCWTCYLLSQTGNTSYEITLETNYGIVYFASTTYEHFHLQVKTHSFLVRGPPVFLLQHS